MAEETTCLPIFLDADDHLMPHSLDVALAAFDAHPGSGFVVGPHEEMTSGEPAPWSVEPPAVQTQLYLCRFSASSGTSSRLRPQCSGAKSWNHRRLPRSMGGG